MVALVFFVVDRRHDLTELFIVTRLHKVKFLLEFQEHLLISLILLFNLVFDLVHVEPEVVD